VRVWNLATGGQIAPASQRVRRLFARFRSHRNLNLSLALSVGGRRAVSADSRHAVSGDSSGTVRVWDLDSGAALHTLTGHQGVNAVAVSGDGRRAVSGGDDGKIQVWDLDSGAALHTLTGHNQAVTAVAVSADGRRAVSGGYDRSVRVWDLAQGAELACFVSDSDISALAATPSGMRVIGGTSTGPVLILELRACD